MGVHPDPRRLYRVHARFYDATRWAFLFGRDALVEDVIEGPEPAHVLEVGCGTGRNLARLAAALPNTRFTGIDLSPDMLVRARRRLRAAGDRVTLLEGAYAAEQVPPGSMDVVLFSYSLTMMGERRRGALAQAAGHLAPGGRILCADFHETPSGLVRRWMALHGVDMSGDTLRALEEILVARRVSVRSAFGGLWSWFIAEAAPRD